MENKILILTIIILIEAMFSATETALTYINKAKISQMSKTNKKAQKIKLLMKDSHRFYGIVETTIIMCKLFATIFVAEEFVHALIKALSILPISENYISIISIVVITLILSYVLIVFGSVLPKKAARNHPEETAFRWINIVWLVSRISHPFERLIFFSTKLFSKIFGIKDSSDERMTEKEIKMIINEGHEQGIIGKFEKEILVNALKYDTILVKKIMIPKDKVDFINVEDSKEKILDNIKEYNYTRMPVYEKTKDNIIGIFNVKDIAIEYAKNKQVKVDIRKNLRQVLFVDKEQKISEVFKEMQLNNQAIAIVKEDKKVIGIVTMEDILEKIVGKIFDEFDKK